MATRETSNILKQIGVQSAEGTPVAANRLFAGLRYTMGDSIGTRQFRRQGAKFNTTSVIDREWAEGGFEGPLSYVELVYVLAGLMPYTVEAVSGAAGAYKWTFTPNASGNDTYKVYTLESGDDEDTERYQDLTHQSVDLAWTLDDATMSGDCYAKAMDDSLSALTGSAAELAERPVSPREVDVYIDTTFGAIGTTKVTDAFDARFSQGGKRDQKWVLNSDYQSWKESKEVISDVSLSFTSDHNAQSRALLAALKSNPLRFIRVRNRGALITGTTYYQITIDYCGKIRSKSPNEDMDGVYAFGYEFAAMQESTMGRGFTIEVINMLAAL